VDTVVAHANRARLSALEDGLHRLPRLCPGGALTGGMDQVQVDCTPKESCICVTGNMRPIVAQTDPPRVLFHSRGVLVFLTATSLIGWWSDQANGPDRDRLQTRRINSVRESSTQTDGTGGRGNWIKRLEALLF
jgi:hypothetical protein